MPVITRTVPELLVFPETLGAARAQDANSAPERVEKAEAGIIDLDWRIHGVSIMPRTRLDDPPTGREGAAGASPPRAGAVRRSQ
jgi:hypothetical protein